MAASIVQSKTASNTNVDATIAVTLDATPTAGNYLIAVGMIVYSADFDTPAGWTRVQSAQAWNGAFFGGRTTMFARSATGASATLTLTKTGSVGATLVLYEVHGIGELVTSGQADNQTASTSIPITLATTAGDNLTLFAVALQAEDTMTFSWPAGWTELFDAGFTSTAAAAIGWTSVESSDGSEAATVTSTESFVFGWIIAAFSVVSEPGLFVGSDPIFTDRATSWRITRGASAEITGGAQVGQATVTVRNLDNEFNPENSGSSIAADLVDGSPLWIGVDSDGKMAGTAVYGLFGGYLTDVTPIAVPGPTYPPTVELRAEDVLGRLSRTKVSLALSRTRSHGDLREAVLDEMGITTRTLANEIETMPVSGADGFALSVLEDLNRSTGTRHFIQPGDSAGAWWTYIARDRQWHLSGTAQGTITAGMTGVDPPSGWRRSADTVINQQRVTFTPISFTPATVTVWKADVLPLTLEATSREWWVQFDAFVDSPAVDLTYTGSTVTSTLTPFGDRALLDLTTAGTATITRLEIEGSLARRSPDQSYVADDAVSQALARGIRSGSDISGDYVGTLASARGLAEHVVWRYTNPQVRPTITVTNWIPQQFDLDLFDLIAFSSTQLGVTSRLFEIVGLTHEGRHAATDTVEHVTTYVLQECRVQTETNWFTLDTHAADGSAILGY